MFFFFLSGLVGNIFFCFFHHINSKKMSDWGKNTCRFEAKKPTNL